MQQQESNTTVRFEGVASLLRVSWESPDPSTDNLRSLFFWSSREEATTNHSAGYNKLFNYTGCTNIPMFSSFSQEATLVKKATSPDDVPTPGYVYHELIGIFYSCINLVHQHLCKIHAPLTLLYVLLKNLLSPANSWKSCCWRD